MPEHHAFFGVAKYPNFGGGRVDLRTGKNTGGTQYGETYLEPSINFTYGAGKALGLFGEASAVLTSTLGEGDTGGFTDGTDGDIDIEKAYLGIRTTFNGAGGAPGRWSCRAANRTSRLVMVS